MDLIVHIAKSQLKKPFYLLLLLKLQLKNYFIHYYIETFLPRNNFFDILLVFVFFLQTYYDTYSSRIFFFSFFLLQISFCIYFLPALLASLYYFYSNLLLYLVLCFGFFDNKLNQRSHSFIQQKKKKILKKVLKKIMRLIHQSIVQKNLWIKFTIFAKNTSNNYSHTVKF